MLAQDQDEELARQLHFELNADEDVIPDRAQIESILGALERCSTDVALYELATKVTLPDLPSVMPTSFSDKNMTVSIQ